MLAYLPGQDDADHHENEEEATDGVHRPRLGIQDQELGFDSPENDVSSQEKEDDDGVEDEGIYFLVMSLRTRSGGEIESRDGEKTWNKVLSRLTPQ